MRTSTGRAHSARTRPAAATDVHSTCAMRGSNGNTCVLRRTACTKSSSSSCSTARNPSQDTRACVCRCSLAPGITGIQGPAEQDKVRSRVRGRRGRRRRRLFGEEVEPKGRKGRECKVCGLTRRRSQTGAAREQGVRWGGAGDRRRAEGRGGRGGGCGEKCR